MEENKELLAYAMEAKQKTNDDRFKLMVNMIKDITEENDEKFAEMEMKMNKKITAISNKQSKLVTTEMMNSHVQANLNQFATKLDEKFFLVQNGFKIKIDEIIAEHLQAEGIVGFGQNLDCELLPDWIKRTHKKIEELQN